MQELQLFLLFENDGLETVKMILSNDGTIHMILSYRAFYLLFIYLFGFNVY